tara:strand:+ start:156 stop:371 length:216 start_codon:yes stop_codon:yes gene_type:complete
MGKVTKESFYEANFKIEEEFESAELAANTNSPGDKSKILIQNIKLEKTRIKLNNDKELKKADVEQQQKYQV